MKTLVLGAATMLLMTAANLSAGMAQGPKPSGGTTWPGISGRADTSSAAAKTATPRYEYRYGYDRHAAWRGHWVLTR
jgi:hypothetical protein